MKLEKIFSEQEKKEKTGKVVESTAKEYDFDWSGLNNNGSETYQNFDFSDIPGFR